jgi:hypothetical protein
VAATPLARKTLFSTLPDLASNQDLLDNNRMLRQLSYRGNGCASAVGGNRTRVVPGVKIRLPLANRATTACVPRAGIEPAFSSLRTR